MKKLIVIVLVFCAITGFSQIQKNNKSALTIEQIMQNPDKWIGTSPSGIFWDESGENIYFNWNPERDTLSSLYSYSTKTKKIEKVSVETKINLPGKYGSYNSEKTQKVYTRNGNIYILDIKNEVEKQLTDWIGRASSPRFVLSNSQISFTKDKNLFLINPETRFIRQVTNFVSGEDKQKPKSKGQSKWLEEQQKELFDVLNEREAMSKARENQRKMEHFSTKDASR